MPYSIQSIHFRDATALRGDSSSKPHPPVASKTFTSNDRQRFRIVQSPPSEPLPLSGALTDRRQQQGVSKTTPDFTLIAQALPNFAASPSFRNRYLLLPPMLSPPRHLPLGEKDRCRENQNFARARRCSQENELSHQHTKPQEENDSQRMTTSNKVKRRQHPRCPGGTSVVEEFIKITM